MATMIEVRSQEGKLIIRCDARCYQAKGAVCKCACHGENHGKGFEGAKANTVAFIERLKEIYKDSGLRVRLGKVLGQINLFQ